MALGVQIRPARGLKPVSVRVRSTAGTVVRRSSNSTLSSRNASRRISFHCWDRQSVLNVRAATIRLKAIRCGSYVHGQIALSQQWKLIAGLRYDYFKVEFDDRRTTVPAVDLTRPILALAARGPDLDTQRHFHLFTSSQLRLSAVAEQLSLGDIDQ